MDGENIQPQVVRPSGIRPPSATSRLPQISASQGLAGLGGLHEMSESQSNARAHQSSMPQASNGLKRGLSQPVSQPEPKRKTLAEQAGDYSSRSNNTGVGSVSGRSQIKGYSLKEANKSFSSSTTGLPTSRHTSNSSYASSVGSGYRPPSRSHVRARSTTNTRTARPATSMGTREESKAQNAQNAQSGQNATDIDERLGKFENDFQKMKEMMNSAAMDTDRYVEELDAAKRRVTQLETRKAQLQDDLDDAKRELQSATRDIQYLKDDLEKQKRNQEEDCELLNRKHVRELEEEQRLLSLEREKHQDLLRQFEEKCGREAEAQREQLERELADQRSRISSLRHEKELEAQRLNLQLQERQLQLKNAEEELRKAKDQIEDHEHSIVRLNAKVKQLEENAKSLQEAYGSSENRKDHQIGDMSRQLQELSKRAEAAERSAEEARKAAKKTVEASNEEFGRFKQQLQEKLVREEEKRHKLFEQVQDLKGNIRVMCRIRPPGSNPSDVPVQFDYLESEYDEDKFAGVIIPTEKDHPQEEGKKVPGLTPPFTFERIFDPGCTNKDVFDEISQLVQSVMDGKRVCIFCYGQTGSGKTYTMSNQGPGDEDGDGDDGIIPRAKEMIFREVERLRALGWEYKVEGSYLEVYKNKLYDLLAPRDATPRTLEVKKVSDELEIKDHDFTPLNTEDDLEFMVKTAETNRHVAETNMNRASSRSHSILVLKIHGKKSLGNGKFKTREGTLNLIDLAGSESVGRSGATGDVAEEGRQINMSLTHLGTVLKQLGEGRKKESVDFSSYTLTQLLRPSLGEKCRTLMFVMVSPFKENTKETISSLKFAKNAQKVKQNGGGSKTAGPKKTR